MNTEHAATGDTIEITHPTYRTGEKFVVIDRPSGSRGGDAPGDVWMILTDGPGWLRQEHYKIVNNATNTDHHAQPGDTIEVIHQGDQFGQRHVVVECPPDAVMSPPGCAWHDNPSGNPSFWRKEYYKIVKRKGESVSTPSIVSDTPVDFETSIRKQRDELLRGWFT